MKTTKKNDIVAVMYTSVRGHVGEVLFGWAMAVEKTVVGSELWKNYCSLRAVKKTDKSRLFELDVTVCV